MIRWLVLLFWGPYDCKKHGHDYFARYDKFLDPRLSEDKIFRLLSSHSATSWRYLRVTALSKVYVRDICRYCGDTIERTEGLNAMEVLAHQAKRMG